MEHYQAHRMLLYHIMIRVVRTWTPKAIWLPKPYSLKRSRLQLLS